MPTALVIGAASQDGYYLGQFLLSKGYQVVGTVRPSEQAGLEGLILENADLAEYSSLAAVISKYQPQEIYNLAALSLPQESWSQAALVAQVNAIGPVLLMEAIRSCSPHSKFFQASSREMLNPTNPYAAAKLYAHEMVKIYRNAYHMFAVSGILYNHESPRRPAAFVTRKITQAAAQIKKGTLQKLELWDLGSPRDRGFAGDFVEAMWLMLQNKEPKDYSIATGETHTIKDILDIAFSHVGLDWKGYVVTNPQISISISNPSPPGDISAIKKDLGWSPKTSFKQLIEMMVDSETS